SFLRPFQPREDPRLFEGLGRRGDRLRFRERLGPPPAGPRLGAPPAGSATAGHGQRLGDAGIVRGGALRRLEMGRRLLYVADLEIKEREPLQRAHVVGGDAERHVPFVERALVVVLVGEDARVQVVRVREVRMALEPGQGDAVGGVELPLLAQELAEPQEDETIRVLRELGGQGLDRVRHASPTPRASSRSRRASASSARATSSAKSAASVVRSRFVVPGSASTITPALSSPNSVFATSKSERPSSDAMARTSRTPLIIASISHSG